MLDNSNYNDDLECSVAITVIMIVTLSVIVLKASIKVKMEVLSEMMDSVNNCRNRNFLKFSYTVLQN
jgi:hypothetical protein